MSTVAFLGTGTMGLAMARNLIEAGQSVRAWNRNSQRARPLAERGATVCQEPGEAAEGADIVITMLSEADAVIETAERFLGAARGARWLQMSTIGISATERCAELARDGGLGFVDAPVLGTKQPAEAGKLVVLASGEDEDLEACEPIFKAVGQRTLKLGRAGAGSRAKVVVNTWIVGTVGVLAETISLAEHLGLEPSVFFDAVDGGPLDLPYARLKGGAMTERNFGEVSFRLALARKDAELALEGGGATGGEPALAMPVLEAVTERMRRAEAAGHADLDMAATYLATVNIR